MSENKGKYVFRKNPENSFCLLEQDDDVLSSFSPPEPTIKESACVYDSTVNDENTSDLDETVQADLIIQSNDSVMVADSSVYPSRQHPSSWTVDEVRAWFKGYKLDQLYQTLFALPNPLNGQGLIEIFEYKHKNYDSYRNRYTTRLHNNDPNLLKDFAQFSQLLDTYCTDSYNQRFDIAFSFPGDQRDKVSQIAEILCKKTNTKTNDEMGKERIFYDKYHEAELARPNLDLYLQAIYRYNARLIVVFMGDEYSRREWCCLEARSIRGLIKAGQSHRIMLLSFDNGFMQGITDIDGYLDISTKTNEWIAEQIYKRLKMLDEPFQLTDALSITSASGQNKYLSRMSHNKNHLFIVVSLSISIAIIAYFFGAHFGR